MRTALIGVALALAGTSAHAGPVTITAAPDASAHIGFSDLDLDSNEGRVALERRIRSAAEALCTIDADRTADTALGGRGCYNAAVANGLQQMDKINQQRLAQQREQQSATAAGH